MSDANLTFLTFQLAGGEVLPVIAVALVPPPGKVVDEMGTLDRGFLKNGWEVVDPIGGTWPQQAQATALFMRGGRLVVSSGGGVVYDVEAIESKDKRSAKQADEILVLASTRPLSNGADVQAAANAGFLVGTLAAVTRAN